MAKLPMAPSSSHGSPIHDRFLTAPPPAESRCPHHRGAGACATSSASASAAGQQWIINWVTDEIWFWQTAVAAWDGRRQWLGMRRRGMQRRQRGMRRLWRGMRKRRRRRGMRQR
uniref:Uncharacterized protein n=1 Tax=Oryza nivara TaxID=4536 RepID=A0A0E0GYN0_ORYNI